ncbi:uncharacterized protein LOC143440987 [Arvicanthis niloticus]|uniref:uncharacterized protein LOC143311001 n=1 Tax=Arvicanthis niloticus TaxID=61156 RepID=UPI00402B4BC7
MATECCAVDVPTHWFLRVFEEAKSFLSEGQGGQRLHQRQSPTQLLARLEQFEEHQGHVLFKGLGDFSRKSSWSPFTITFLTSVKTRIPSVILQGGSDLADLRQPTLRKTWRDQANYSHVSPAF